MRTWAPTFLETSIIIFYSIVLFSFLCSSIPHKAHKHTFLSPTWKLSCHWSTSKCTLLPLAITYFPISILNYVTTAHCLDLTSFYFSPSPPATSRGDVTRQGNVSEEHLVAVVSSVQQNQKLEEQVTKNLLWFFNSVFAMSWPLLGLLNPKGAWVYADLICNPAQERWAALGKWYLQLNLIKSISQDRLAGQVHCHALYLTHSKIFVTYLIDCQFSLREVAH